ncbi:acetolactate decarboxylase [Paracrocinitomix mangrovi]|uniref:acetolactate decarboxylase n=1 Tax=Paracrocinitomix mangrovi TaxID=2862509 RepID=UPI001C8D8345|nr:acetolactate decarboxylase [Paracrocinitomix mangrovi]UKN01095.1 acetolactate decarboxylase [Paracrocinitomix mangrovi]
MRVVVLVFLTSFMISCNSSNEKDVDVEETNYIDINVEHAGELKKIMHKNDISAHAKLSDFNGESHLYALGAVEGLKGEILILDGVPYISSVNGDSLKIDNSFDYNASLLVYASIEEWHEKDIPDDVKTYADLEEFVAFQAELSGINMNKPFPFMLKGVADTLNWHVINWPEGDTIHTHEKHVSSGLNGTFTSIDTEILGFYSDSHHGIFTHHSTNMHLHFLSDDKKRSGHLDDLYLGSEVKLLLPVTRK